MGERMILLVDDEEVIQKSLSRYLKEEGYNVTTARSGDEAIGKLKQEQYDLVMTDLVMEGTDGIQVLMKAKEFYPKISVMILTGYGSMRSAIDALRHGADDYLLKTCDLDELLFRITQCFEIHNFKERGNKPTEDIEKTNKKLKAEISKRKQIEKELRIKDRITDIFLTVSNEEMFTKVLKIILEALGSKHGFFGYIEPNGAFIHPSIIEKVWGKGQLADSDIILPQEKWGNIWTQALKKKKVLYHNKCLHISQGNIPIKRAMVAPVIHHDKTIGIIAVSNKSTDYNEEDRMLLKCIASHIAPIQGIKLEKIREESARKQALEKLRLCKKSGSGLL
jgi:DNA-binding response OmpR family regulator